MNSLGTLIQYEWKKLFHKRMARIAVIAAVLLQTASLLLYLMESSVTITEETGPDGSVTTKEEVMSGYEKMLSEKKNAQALDGRVIDGALIDETLGSYNQGKDKEQYSEITRLLGTVLSGQAAKADEDLFYRTWKANLLETAWEEYRLSSREVQYWRNEIGRIETPFTYEYGLAWRNMLTFGLTIGVVLLLLAASCLSGVFADEYRRGTDQLILCARNGKAPVYAAKIITGTLFGAGCTLLLYGISFAFSFGFWGVEGFNAILQIEIVYSPYAISVGQAVMILFGVTVLAAILHSVVSMALSVYLKNGVAVLLIMVAVMIVANLVEVPSRWRFWSQLHSLLPTNASTAWRFLDLRTVRIFGRELTYFGAAAILYPLLAAGAAFAGKKKYG